MDLVLNKRVHRGIKKEALLEKLHKTLVLIHYQEEKSNQ